MQQGSGFVQEEGNLAWEEEDTQKDKYLTFSLDGEVYALDIRYVTEIVGIQKITKVPDLPSFIKGVINLRGKVIPVMDVRARFGLQPREYDERTCVVVVQVADAAMGLVVDHVNEVMDMPAAQVEPPPDNNRNQTGRYVRGIGKMEEEVKIVLDVERLVG
jgi:purine-binding chemotaxis protein CheW